MPGHYRDHLQSAVASSAAPYGYTLTIWTSGAVSTHHRGIPTGWEALLFLAGAVMGFALIGAIAHGGARRVFRAPQEPTVRLWGGFHIPSVGLAIAASGIVAATVPGVFIWPAVGFVATSIYLLVIAGQFTVADSRRGLEREAVRDAQP
jgi:hypothetical protein